MFFFDPLYLLFALPGLLLGLWAQWRVKNVFQQYSQVRLTRQQTGAQIARQILQRSGVSHIDVERVDGFLAITTTLTLKFCDLALKFMIAIA